MGNDSFVPSTTPPDLPYVVLSLDIACFALEGDILNVLLVKRGFDPFTGWWALPGATAEADETLDEAAARILASRTGVTGEYLEQLYTFGDPDRDPRGRTVSVAYYALLALGDHAVHAGPGVEAVAWFPVKDMPPLAFDHSAIAAYAYQRLQQKITYAPLVFRVLPETFTMRDLRLVHEAVLDRPLHPSNFTRQMHARWDLAPVSGSRDRRSRRPARLFRYIGPQSIEGPPRAEDVTAEPTGEEIT